MIVSLIVRDMFKAEHIHPLIHSRLVFKKIMCFWRGVMTTVSHVNGIPSSESRQTFLIPEQYGRCIEAHFPCSQPYFIALLRVIRKPEGWKRRSNRYFPSSFPAQSQVAYFPRSHDAFRLYESHIYRVFQNHVGECSRLPMEYTYSNRCGFPERTSFLLCLHNILYMLNCRIELFTQR